MEISREVILSVQNPDENIRVSAENVISNVVSSDPQGALSSFLSLMSDPDMTVRTYSIVIFRRYILDDVSSECILASVDANIQKQVVSKIFESFLAEQQQVVLRQYAALIGAVASYYISEDPNNSTQSIPQLWELINSCTESSNTHKIAALTTLNEVFQFTPQDIVLHIQMVLNFLAASFSSNDVELATAAAITSCQLLLFFDDIDEVISNALPLTEAIVQAVYSALQAGEEDSAIEILQEMSETYCVADILKKCFSKLLSLLVPVVNAEGLPPSVQSPAIELIVSVAETLPKLFRRMGGPIYNAIFPRLLSIISYYPCDEQTWELSQDHSELYDSDEATLAYVSEDGLDRFSLALGAKTVLPIIMQAFNEQSVSPNEQDRYAILLAVALVAEGVAKRISGNDAAVLFNGVVKLVNDPCSRVRWAALRCILRFIIDWDQRFNFSSENHASFVPVIINCLSNDKSVHCRIKAAECITTLTEGAQPEVVELYTSDFLNAISGLFQFNRVDATSAALATIGDIANSVRYEFAPFYASYMGQLRSMIESFSQLSNEQLAEQFKVCCACIETISNIGYAVGPDLFVNDAAAIMQFFIQFHNRVNLNNSATDVIGAACLKGYQSIIPVLRKNSAPFVDHLVKICQKYFTDVENYKTCTRNEAERLCSIDSGRFTIQMELDDGRCLVSLGISEDQEECHYILSNLLLYAPEACAPFFKEIFEIANQSSSYTSSRFTVLGYLAAAVTQTLGDQGLSILSHIAETLLKKSSATNFENISSTSISEVGAAFEVWFKKVTDSMPLTKQYIVSILPTLLSYTTYIVERANGINDSGSDEEENYDNQQLEEDYDDNVSSIMKQAKTIGILTTAVSQLVGSVSRVLNVHALDFVQNFLSVIVSWSSPQATLGYRMGGTQMLADLMEFVHQSPEVQNFVSNIDGISVVELLLKYLEYSEDTSYNVPAAYALKIYATFYNDFGKYALSAAQKCVTLLQSPEAKSNTNYMFVDNIISCLVVVSAKYADQIQNSADFFKFALSNCPLHEDEDEEKSLAEYLCDLVRSQHPIVSQSAKEITETLVRMYKHHLIVDELDTNIQIAQTFKMIATPEIISSCQFKPSEVNRVTELSK